MNPALAPTLRHAVHYARRRGLVRALAKAVASALGGRQSWYVTRGELAPWAGATPRDPEIDVRLAVPDDVPALAAFGRQHADTLRTWLRPGHFLFVAERRGELIAYRALSTMPHRWVADYFRLRPDQIYGLDVFTSRAWRGRGVTHDLMLRANPVLLARGYREVLSIQRADNAESIAMTRARGIARVGTLTRTCVLGWVRFSFEPAGRPAAMRLSASGPSSTARAW